MKVFKPVKNKIIYAVIILTIVSLTVLAVIQVRWLEDASKLASQKFDERVNNAMTSFTYLNEDFIHSNFQVRIDRPDLIENELQSRLKEAFEMEYISTPFNIAVMNSDQQVIIGKPIPNPDQCRFPLTCNYFLAVDFPDKSQFVTSEVGKTMAPSILSIFILGSSVFYLYFLFKKQKRISAIKNDFISNMTHEFKTPLSSISLSNHVLQNSKETTKEDLQTYYDVIDLETKRLQSHIDKILQLAQMDAGNFSLDKKEIHLNEVIHKVIHSFDPWIQQGKLKIDLKLTRDSEIKGDEAHLSNVLYNLIDNAVKYSKGDPKVLICTRRESDKLILEVGDNGIGMNKKVQRQVFDKFYRGDISNVHDVKGFGLGLNYVRNIIKAHKGAISLSSTPGKGSRFNIELPI